MTTGIGMSHFGVVSARDHRCWLCLRLTVKMMWPQRFSDGLVFIRPVAVDGRHDHRLEYDQLLNFAEGTNKVIGPLRGEVRPSPDLAASTGRITMRQDAATRIQIMRTRIRGIPIKNVANQEHPLQKDIESICLFALAL